MVAHRDSVRGIIKEIDRISDDVILNVTIPAGIPLLYSFDANLNPIITDEINRPSFSSALYLDGGKKDHLVSALEKDSHWRLKFDSGPSRRTLNVGTTIERALWQLRHDEQLAFQLHNPEKKQQISSVLPNDSGGLITNDRWADDPIEAEDFEFFSDQEDTIMNDDPGNEVDVANILPVTTINDLVNDPVIVFVRHGRTPHNIMGLFTGFQDPP